MREKYFYQDRIYKLGKFLTTSKTELKDIGKAWIIISIAFGILLGGLTLKFFSAFIIALLSVGIAFLLHELSHKYFAQKYGYLAEFRSFDEMLFLAVIMSFFGFIFAAPGAVVIFTKVINIRKNGIISAAGPLMNIFLALMFFSLAFFVSGNLDLLKMSFEQILELPIWLAIIAIGFLVNSWLALFNMIPFWMFDGAKIFRWNKLVYFLVLIISIFLVFFLVHL